MLPWDSSRITPSDGVTVALVTQHATRMRHVTLPAVSLLSPAYSSIAQTARFSKNKKVIENVRRVLIFSTFLSILILRTVQQDITTNEHPGPTAGAVGGGVKTPEIPNF
jgi:hypothetical protein